MNLKLQQGVQILLSKPAIMYSTEYFLFVMPFALLGQMSLYSFIAQRKSKTHETSLDVMQSFIKLPEPDDIWVYNNQCNLLDIIIIFASLCSLKKVNSN